MNDFWRCFNILLHAGRCDPLAVDKVAAQNFNDKPVLQKIVVKIRGGKCACWSVRDALTTDMNAGNFVICGHRGLRATVEQSPARRPMIAAGAKCMNTLQKDFGLQAQLMHKPGWGRDFTWYAVADAAGTALSPQKQLVIWREGLGYELNHDVLARVLPGASAADVEAALAR